MESKTQVRRKTYFRYILLLPPIIILLVVFLYPLMYSLSLSFRSWDITLRPEPGPFIGFKNYIDVLSSARFGHSIKVTFVIVAISVSFEFFIGLGIALLLNAEAKGGGILRSLMLLPFITAPVLVGQLWRYLFSTGYGLIDFVLQRYMFAPLGISTIWMGTPSSATAVIIITDIWQSTPLVALIFLAGLFSVPKEPIEAAVVDGASSYQTFRYIIVPHLKPTMIVVLLIRTVDGMKMFDKIRVLTAGGPGYATEVITYRIYTEGFNYYRMSKAAAMSYLLVGIMIILTVLFTVNYFKGRREGKQW